jgi:hypothetical protein
LQLDFMANIFQSQQDSTIGAVGHSGKLIFLKRTAPAASILVILPVSVCIQSGARKGFEGI